MKKIIWWFFHLLTMLWYQNISAPLQMGSYYLCSTSNAFMLSLCHFKWVHIISVPLQMVPYSIWRRQITHQFQELFQALDSGAREASWTPVFSSFTPNGVKCDPLPPSAPPPLIYLASYFEANSWPLSLKSVMWSYQTSAETSALITQRKRLETIRQLFWMRNWTWISF